jgi:hypothetical protein
MEAKYSSEMSVDFQRTTLHYIPEDRALHNHRPENFRSDRDIDLFSDILSYQFTDIVWHT